MFESCKDINMNIDKAKARTLIDKTRDFDGILLTKHDSANDRRTELANIKRKLDGIQGTKEYVVCVFEV
jgi:hypothetical protein